jgi:polyvinyl alcohol dehydrogenase (cytochrome)
MKNRSSMSAGLALAATLLLPVAAGATCPSSCPLPGGGAAKQDCHAEFASTALRLNYPPFDPARPRPRREVRCFDGDPGCDLDGIVNGECSFDVDVCLLMSPDPALPTCTPAAVTAVSVPNPLADPQLGALATALGGLLPHVADACTSGQTLRVPLRNAGGSLRRGSKSVRVNATTASGTDMDSVKLTCVPRGWPSHGYDGANRRATPAETTLGPGNAASLAVKWTLDLQTLSGGSSNAVTSTPTVGNGMVYVTSWNGKAYGVSARTGALKWQYDTGSGVFLGSQSSPTLTADGRVLFGDSQAGLHCLNAKTGKLLWRRTIGNPAVDHVWSSPTVANGRVFVGIASHSDNPCTQGRLVAVDLDTGADLWTVKTVPDKICHNDTSITCTTDADCGGGAGTCIAAIGAGVTATVAVDPAGETVFMNTVGCYTFPSVGDEDSIFRIDAATGTTTWKTRVKPPEQFNIAPYHDFGFLNGPILVDADDGLGGTRPLVVSGSKDGTLYALDPATGGYVWTRVLLPTPVSPAFAGFGLFNGGLGFADQRFYASLYQFTPPVVPAPEHLMAFSAVDGSTVWQDEIGISWGSIGLANGLLFTGTMAASEFYVYDATLGTRLKTFTMPSNVTSGPSIVDGSVYVGYGVFGPAGGVMAFALP